MTSSSLDHPGPITAATYARLSRSTLLDTLGRDYIRTTRAKGLSSGAWSTGTRSGRDHSIVTQFGIDLAGVLGGAIIAKSIFGLPGVGRNVVLAVGRQDLPVIEGVVLWRRHSSWSPTSSSIPCMPSSTRGCASPSRLRVPGRAGPPAAQAAGRVSRKVVPSPSVLDPRTRSPPIRRANSRLM